MKKTLAGKTLEYLNIANVIFLVVKKNYTVELINKKGCDILGYEKDEIIGKNWFDHFIPPEKRESLKETFSQIIEGRLEEVDSYENELITKTGERRLIKWKNSFLKDEKGSIISFLSSGEDVTNWKALENESNPREKMFKALVQNSQDPIAVIDASGIYKYVSDAAKKVLGYEPEELMGRNTFDFLHQDSHFMILKVLKNVLKYDHVDTKPFRFLHKNGEWKWLESNATNCSADPDVNGIIINSRDVTERILLKQKLEKEHALHQKNITAAVIKAQERERSLIGQELHDNVNQMLATVKLCNEIVLEKIGGDDILKKSIKYVQESINEIRRISKHLLVPPTNISLKEAIADLINSFHISDKILFNYSITGLDEHIPSAELHLCIYRIFQEQLNNIITHAEATVVSIELSYDQQYISLVMRDNGKGFDIMSKKNGIGLINMKTRAESLNGSFKIHSYPGKGCQMIASFPFVGSMSLT